MDCSMPGFPVHHQLPENAQTHVHWVGDTIQPSHPLSSPSPPAFNLSQHQRSFPMSQFFPSGGQSFGSFSISLSNEYSGLISFRMDFFGLLAVQGTLKSLFQHRKFESLKVWKHQFFGSQLSLWSNSHIHTWLVEKPELWLYRPLLAKYCLCFVICWQGWSQLFFQGASVF